jgi:hypothetical protein
LTGKVHDSLGIEPASETQLKDLAAALAARFGSSFAAEASSRKTVKWQQKIPK